MATVLASAGRFGATVTGRYFGTGDGARTTFNLAGLDSDVAYVAPALYTTDWRGGGITPTLLLPTNRTNLCVQSQTLNVSWNGATYPASATPNTTVAPDGTTTADTITATAGATPHALLLTPAASAGQQYTFSAYFKAGTNTFVALGDAGDAVWHVVNFNMVNKTVQTQTNATGTMTDVGNGWYRCTCTFTRTNAGTFSFGPVLQDAGNRVTFQSWNAAGTETVFAWGFQLETGSVATSYIPTVAAAASVTDYTLHATSGLVTFASAPVAAAILSYKQPWAPSSNVYMCFGTGDGTSTAYSLPYAPVTPAISKAGVLLTVVTDYTVAPSGLVTFVAAPAAAASLTWTGSMGPMP